MRTDDVELGFLAHGVGGPHPGVVMLHDVWGLADHTRDLACRLAGEGFGVLALDLYRREAEVKITDPGAWMRGLSDPQILADVQAGIDFLAGSDAARGRPVGVTGFCMGGMYALLSACSCRDLSASVPYYGMLSYEHGLFASEDGLDPALKPRQPLDAVADLGCPLLAFFGEEDTFIPMNDVEVLKSRLAESTQPHEVVAYPNAGHAFMNDTRPEMHRPDAAKDAWGRMLAFLHDRLG